MSFSDILSSPKNFHNLSFLSANGSFNTSDPWTFLSLFEKSNWLFQLIKHFHQLIFGILCFLSLILQLLFDSLPVNQPSFLPRQSFKSRKVIDRILKLNVTNLKLTQGTEFVQWSILASEETMVFRVIEVIIQEITNLTCWKGTVWRTCYFGLSIESPQYSVNCTYFSLMFTSAIQDYWLSKSRNCKGKCIVSSYPVFGCIKTSNTHRCDHGFNIILLI